MSDVQFHRPFGKRLYIPAHFSTSDTLTASVIGTTETAFAKTIALPAGWFTLNRALRIFLGIEVSTTVTVPTYQMRMRVQKAGPVNVNLYQATAAAVVSATTTTTSFAQLFVIQGTAAPGASVSVETAIHQSGLGGFTRNIISPSALVDTASAQTIQFTMQYGAATAGNNCTLRQVIVEELY